jgi:hypothetical protein
LPDSNLFCSLFRVMFQLRWSKRQLQLAKSGQKVQDKRVIEFKAIITFSKFPQGLMLMSVHCSAFHVSNGRLLLLQERIASHPLGSWKFQGMGLIVKHVRRFFDTRVTVLGSTHKLVCDRSFWWSSIISNFVQALFSCVELI